MKKTVKIPIATTADCLAAWVSRTVRKRSITCGSPMIPSTRPMLSESAFQLTVLSDRSGSITLAPKLSNDSFIGPSGFQPARDTATTNTVSTITASRLVLKIWM